MGINLKDLYWNQKLNNQDNELPVPPKIKSEQLPEKKQNESPSGVQNVHLEQYITDAFLWIDEVSALIKMSERKDLAWSTLRAVLHALRDRMTTEDVFHLSAQLPTLIRGMYFEGYHFGNKPERMNVDGLLLRINQGMGPAPKVDGKQAFKAVLWVLHNHVSKGEMDNIYAIMPKDIRTLWNESMKTFTV